MDNLSTNGIARLLGLTQKYVTGRLVTRPDFPKPVVNLSQKTRLWSKSDVLTYCANDRRARGRPMSQADQTRSAFSRFAGR